MLWGKREDEAQPKGELIARVPSETRGALKEPTGTSRDTGFAPPRDQGSAPQLALPGPGQLVVGPGISLSGEIAACDRLVIQGSAQVTLKETRAIEIAETGRFTNGRAEVDEAVIAGVYEGDLLVRGRLVVRATGRVSGTVRYNEVEVERGGRLLGSVETLATAPAEPRKQTAAENVPAEERSPEGLSASAEARGQTHPASEIHELLRP